MFLQVQLHSKSVNRWHLQVHQHLSQVNSLQWMAIVVFCPAVCGSAAKWKMWHRNCMATTMMLNWAARHEPEHSKRPHSKSENFYKVQICIKYRDALRDHGKQINLIFCYADGKKVRVSWIIITFIQYLQYNQVRLSMASASMPVVYRPNGSNGTAWSARYDVNSGECRTLGSMLSSDSQFPRRFVGILLFCFSPFSNSMHFSSIFTN